MGNEQRARSLAGRVQTRWMLLLIFIFSVTLVFALADTDNATAFGLRTLTTSSPISPAPTPVVITLNAVNPSRGANSVVVYVSLYGQNLRDGGQLYLRYALNQEESGGTTERPLIPIHSEYVNSGKLIARIPARVAGYPLKPGYYDFVLVYSSPRLASTSQSAELKKAYRVLNAADVNDLYAESYHLSTIPSQLWTGEETQLMLKVHRLGGIGGTGQFNVDFYAGSLAQENFIGRATVPGISPNGAAASSLVAWTPQSWGKVKILAVIDPENAVVESDEDNNVVITERTVSLVQGSDTYPPTIHDLRVNGGEAEVGQRTVSLSAIIEDGVDPNKPAALVSGPNSVYYVELHWYSGVANGSGSWIPVNWTQWMPYNGEATAFVLHPTSGLRFLQAWGADAAGNISSLPAGRSLTYIPEEDEVAAGEIRVYRKEVAAGQCLKVEVTPSQNDMDPDLYVWSPAGSLQGLSNNSAGIKDTVTIQPTATGSYQIEVEGFTDAGYHLTIQVTDSCAGERSGIETQETSAKMPRSMPSIPVSEAPNLDEAPMPQADITQSIVFLSVITNGDRSEFAGADKKIYLPALTR